MYDRKQMFKATCNECGNECEVPFKPTGGKPVLCSDCFGNQGNKHRGGSGDRNNRSGDRTMHQATCDKCGNKCEVPFRPTEGKPIYCNDCFSKKSDRGDRRGGGGRDRRGGGGSDQVSQQFASLNNKLDRIISLLESGAVKKETPKKESAVKAVLKKPAAEKKTKAKAPKKPVKKPAKKKK